MDREAFLALLNRLFGDGDPLNAEEMASLVAAAAEHATDDELALIEAACQELGAEDDTPLDVVRAAVDLVDAVRAEAQVRLQAAEAEAEERAALRARLTGEAPAEGESEGTEPMAETDPEGEPGEPAPEEPAEPEGEPAPEGEPEPAAEPAEPVAEPEPELEPVAASAAPTSSPRRAAAPRQVGAPAARRPSGQPVLRQQQQRQRNRIMGDNGREWADMRALSEAMFDRRNSFLYAQPGIRENIQLAKIIADYPTDRCLDGMNAAGNAALFQRIVNEMGGDFGVTMPELEAVTAAGGFCAPATPFYAIPRISQGDRPVRDSLIGYRAVRGGITFRPPSDLSDFGSAVTEWTRANDVTPGSDGRSTKACLTVQCLGTETAYLWAVVRCLRFGNFMAMADPESVDDATNKTMDAFAREAERLLLDEIKAQSTLVEAGQVFGAFRDLLYHWGVTATAYRNRRRMRPDAVLELRAPAWVRDMIREDVARSLNSTLDQFTVADSLINSALAVRNIRPYWYIDSPHVTGIANNVDQIFGAQGTGALHDFREHVQWQMSPPGTFLFMENGELNLGVVRDSTLNDTNDYETFAESFEGVAQIGYQSIWGISNVCPNGASAGTTSPDGLCASSGEYLPTGSGLAAFSAP